MKPKILCIRILESVFLVLSFGIVMIAAGHGIGPIGYLLIAGRAPEWYFGIVSSWVGIGFIVVGLFRNSPNSYIGQHFIGLIAILISWVYFLLFSEDKLFTLATSIPFLVFSVIHSANLFLFKKIIGGSASEAFDHDFSHWELFPVKTTTVRFFMGVVFIILVVGYLYGREHLRSL